MHTVKYFWHTVQLSNSSIWPIDKTISGATSPVQSGPGSNGYEGVLHISQSFRTEASPSDCFVSYPGHSRGGGILPLCRDAVGVFYSPPPADWARIKLVWIHGLPSPKPIAWARLKKRQVDIFIHNPEWKNWKPLPEKW